MADITKVSPSVEPRSAMRAVILEGDLLAGEALSAGDAVFIHSDGKLYQSDAVDHVDTLELTDSGTDTIDIVVSKFVGMVNEDYAAGEPVTVFGHGAIFNYGSGLTEGAFYWVSGTQGALSDARVATGDSAVAMAISTQDILVIR
jgi:hypothetical protein